MRKASIPSVQPQLNINATPQCQCIRQQTQRQFSSTPRNATRQRRAMFNWLNGPGASFRHPLPGSTNYLNAYDESGHLIRATQKERPKNEESEAPSEDRTPNFEKNIQGEKAIPRETLDDLMPFPMNRQFRSEPVLSEELKDEIYRMWKEDGKSVRRISSDMQVEMRRVGAVIRLKSVEKDWIEQVCPKSHAQNRHSRERHIAMMRQNRIRLVLKTPTMVTKQLQLSDTHPYLPLPTSSCTTLGQSY